LFRKNKPKSQQPLKEATSTAVVAGQQSSIQKFRSMNKRMLVMMVAVAVVVALAVVGVIKQSKSNNKADKTSSIVCNDELLNNVSGVLTAENVELLMPLAQDIQKMTNYEKDPNCLNVVITYFIHISDFNNARAHLDKLETVYKEDQGFSSKLGNNAKSLATLRLNVNFLEEQNKRINETGGVPSPRLGE
jgi:hypothetical protein